MSRPTVFTSDDMPLVDAYRWHRQNAIVGVGYISSGVHAFGHAHFCLLRARRDVANGKARWPASSRPFPAVSWQAPDTTPVPFKRKERLGFVADPVTANAGLRLVGRADEFGLRSIDHKGWYSDAFQDETIFGVVFQLPGRDGVSRFVAGYQASGEEGAMVDLGTIFEAERSGDYWNVDPKDHDAARDAARLADSMAEAAAESARDYELAWRAGSEWAEAKEEVASIRKDVRETLADRRAVKNEIRAAGYPISSPAWARACGLFRASVSRSVDRIAELRSRMGRLSGGDHEGRIFYPNARLKAAFNEGAGEAVL